MPRIVKEHPPTVPIIAYFHFPPHVWDAISSYAYQHNRGVCSVMQDFLEVGLLDYLQYDQDLLRRYNLMDIPLSPSVAFTCDNHFGD